MRTTPVVYRYIVAQKVPMAMRKTGADLADTGHDACQRDARAEAVSRKGSICASAWGMERNRNTL